MAQLGEQRTLRLHAFTCRGFSGPQDEADSPAESPPEEPSYPSDTAKSLDDTIQDAVARAKAQVSPCNTLSYTEPGLALLAVAFVLTVSNVVELSWGCLERPCS